MKYTFIIKSNVPLIKCYWCGNDIPVVTTRPKTCPYCGGKL